METFNNLNERKSINKVLISIITIGILLMLLGIGYVLTRPTPTQIEEETIQNAFREGSPEFAQYTKKIIAETNENATFQSPTFAGSINMYINGTIRNLSGKTLSGLELEVSVVNMANNPIKQKIVVIVPTQKEKLYPNETMPVTVRMEGFNPDDDRANIRWKVTAIKVE